jgi:hypothetical protein
MSDAAVGAVLDDTADAFTWPVAGQEPDLEVQCFEQPPRCGPRFGAEALS